MPNPIVVDVRDELRAGREPFQKIMAAAGKVPVGGKLVLYATFKPVPLIAVLKSQGFHGEPTEIEGGDWRVDFLRQSAPEQSFSPETDSVTEADGGGSESLKTGTDAQTVSDIHLDNRGLEPPEPMVRTLEAILDLQKGQKIVGKYDRTPMFLLPKLKEMGYAYEVQEEANGRATVIITKSSNQ